MEENKLKEIIDEFFNCYDTLMEFGCNNLNPGMVDTYKRKMYKLLELYLVLVNSYREVDDNLHNEYELGAVQARYENNKDWEERLKGERANCIYKAGSYDIDDATIQQHKYIGGFEAINRILKDI